MKFYIFLRVNIFRKLGVLLVLGGYLAVVFVLLVFCSTTSLQQSPYPDAKKQTSAKSAGR
jgi:hypothetical protein